MLIDQRAASVNKDVLTQIELMIVHRHTSPQDRKALLEWVRANDSEGHAESFQATIATLSRGEAWVWSPEWLNLLQREKISLARTFDSSATPKPGEVPIIPKKLADVDLPGLREKLTKAAEQAKANDPAILKRRILELEKQLKAAAVTNAAPPPPEKEYVVSDEAISLLANSEQLLEEVRSAYQAVKDGVLAMVPKPLSRAALASRTVQSPGPAKAIARPPRPVASAKAERPEGMTSAQSRILQAVAWWEVIGVTAPSRPQVGFVAGIKPTGGHFSNSIGPLVTGGYLSNTTGGGVELTDAGRDLVDTTADFPTLADYHARIRSVLATGAQERIFDAIVAGAGESMTVQEIGEATGIDPSGGHFSNSIGPLSTLGLVDRRGGQVTPTDLLFPDKLTSFDAAND